MKINKYGILGCIMYILGLESKKRDSVAYSLATMDYLYKNHLLNEKGDKLYESIKKIIK